jgi:hypothetical protein
METVKPSSKKTEITHTPKISKIKCNFSSLMHIIPIMISLLATTLYQGNHDINHILAESPYGVIYLSDDTIFHSMWLIS